MTGGNGIQNGCRRHKAGFRAFDELSARMRALLNVAPIPYCPGCALYAERRLGADGALALFRDVISDAFPSFRWPEGEPDND